MLVLALDTAQSAATAVVARDGAVLSVRSEPMARGHQEAVALLTQAVVADAGVAFEALDRIGVTVGPGSFTGLRVGLAFAKGLALAWSTPLVGLGSLEALAEALPRQGCGLAAIDAGRGQIYRQWFRDGAPVGPPAQLLLADLVQEASTSEPFDGVGTGAAAVGKTSAVDFPSPAALARLTERSPAPVGPPRPLYLRAPDAKTLAERGIVR